jgi:hypothetical protein
MTTDSQTRVMFVWLAEDAALSTAASTSGRFEAGRYFDTI